MSNDSEKWKNLICFNVFATDKELEEMAPFLGIILVIVLVCLFIFGRGCFEQEKPKNEPVKVEKTECLYQVHKFLLMNS